MAVGLITIPYVTTPNDPSQLTNLINANLGAEASFLKSGHVRYTAPIAAELVSIKAAATPANGTITIAAQPDYPRKFQVRIVIGTPTTTQITAGTLTLVGTNAQGQSVTEVISLVKASSATVTTTNAYAHLTSGTVANYAADGSGTGNTLGIGVATALGLPLPAQWYQLTVYKANVGNANETIGTVDSQAGTIVPNTAANASNNYDFWYTYSSPF